MSRKYYNVHLDSLLIIHEDGETYILGDNSEQVSDEDVLKLANNKQLSDWQEMP